MNYKECIELDSINKLIDTDIYKIDSFDEIVPNLSQYFDKLDDSNIYVRKIKYLWNKLKTKENIINLKSEDVAFIEIDFNGGYEDFLIFIIPRIIKLNGKHINKLIKEEISPDPVKNLISEDKDYVQILEVNINNLQIEISNLSNIIFSKMSLIEDKMDSLENKIEELEKKNDTVNINISNLENKNKEIDNDTKKNVLLIEKLKNYLDSQLNQKTENLNSISVNLKENIDTQGMFTKNSILALEQRISKIIEIIR